VQPVLKRFKELDADGSGFLDKDDLVSAVIDATPNASVHLQCCMECRICPSIF
jgi:hypothetical protein